MNVKDHYIQDQFFRGQFKGLTLGGTDISYSPLLIPSHLHSLWCSSLVKKANVQFHTSSSLFPSSELSVTAEKHATVERWPLELDVFLAWTLHCFHFENSSENKRFALHYVLEGSHTFLTSFQGHLRTCRLEIQQDLNKSKKT